MKPCSIVCSFLCGVFGVATSFAQGINSYEENTRFLVQPEVGLVVAPGSPAMAFAPSITVDYLMPKSPWAFGLGVGTSTPLLYGQPLSVYADAKYHFDIFKNLIGTPLPLIAYGQAGLLFGFGHPSDEAIKYPINYVANLGLTYPRVIANIPFSFSAGVGFNFLKQESDLVFKNDIYTGIAVLNIKVGVILTDKRILKLYKTLKLWK